MTVKEYLTRLSVLKRKADHKKQELRCVKRAGMGCRPRTGTGKVQTSFRPAGCPTERYAVRIAALEDSVNKSLLSYLEERDSMVNQIHELDNGSYIDILHKRYVEEIRNFESIAEDMGYSYQYVLNKHSKALKAFENKFPELF